MTRDGRRISIGELNVKRLAVTACLALVLTGFSVIGTSQSAALASSGATQFYGPYAVTAGDVQTCGNVWAQVSWNALWKVRSTGSGTWDVTMFIQNGTFVTNAGASPGACGSRGAHGSMVAAGIAGNVQGVIEGTISGGTFDPNACSVHNCNGGPFRFLGVSFSNLGSFGCFTGADCHWVENYSSSDPSLAYHHFQFYFSNMPPGNVNTGDIATS